MTGREWREVVDGAAAGHPKSIRRLRAAVKRHDERAVVGLIALCLSGNLDALDMAFDLAEVDELVRAHVEHNLAGLLVWHEGEDAGVDWAASRSKPAEVREARLRTFPLLDSYRTRAARFGVLDAAFNAAKNRDSSARAQLEFYARTSSEFGADALGRLVLSFYGPTRVALRKCGLSTDLADDVLNDLWSPVSRRIANRGWRGIDSFEAWMRIAIRNQVIRLAQRDRARPTDSLDVDDVLRRLEQRGDGRVSVLARDDLFWVEWDFVREIEHGDLVLMQKVGRMSAQAVADRLNEVAPRPDRPWSRDMVVHRTTDALRQIRRKLEEDEL